ncbi:hypothetical protein HPB48_008703 [Haemaphysalis longicornis]|uniref:Ran gtpase-activating protein n=1 Tax=Haemaphysalis longicornis TaxID=44386 RepID=A0A9J6GYP9_HAELO|nr:hypothetical protein HPB48_008703 [Haemaphysalis longicornis]
MTHLDLLRDCTDSMDSCWLCDELQEWNAALKAFQIDIQEPLPGKLALAIIPEGPPVHQDDPDDTAYLWIWLLRKHRCIETLKLHGSSFRHNVAVPDLVAGFASNLRHIAIEDGEFAYWSSVLDAIGPINNLRSFTLTGYGVLDALLVKLAELLSANANSLREVHVDWLSNAYGLSNDSRSSDIVMSGISSCKNLASLAFRAELGSPGSESLAMLLRSSRTLKEFWLDRDPAIEEAFCDFMRTNTTLTELHYSCRYARYISDVLRSVENDNTLELLAIDCRLSALGNPLVMVQCLRSLLSNNRRLRTLKIKNAEICGKFGGLLAEGLSENETLECLDASNYGVLFEAVQPLCHALTINKTCSVKLHHVEASPLEREALARTLSEGKLYGRVQLTWTDFDAAGLRAALQQTTARCIDLVLSTEHLSCASFALLCQALSSSRLVYSLAVNLSSDTTPEHVDNLCNVLKKTLSLTRVKLIEHDCKNQGFAVRAAHVLRSNTSVTHLKILCNGLTAQDAELLRYLMAESQRLNVVELEVEAYVWRCDHSVRVGKLDAQTMDILSQGMTENRFITSVELRTAEQGTDQTAFMTTLTRNKVRLNRAARFVLGRNRGKLCAEAFELFEAQPSLVARVTEASGMSGRDAEAAVRSAKHFISDNYFFITQVVRDKLECLPGEGTQIDQLNPACWRRILDYLKVADVIVP